MDKVKELFWPPTKKDFFEYLENQPRYKGHRHFIIVIAAMTVLFYSACWLIVTTDTDYFSSPRSQPIAWASMFAFPFAVYALYVRETKKFVKNRDSNKIVSINKGLD